MRIRTHTNPLSYHERFELKDWKTIFPQFNGQLDLEIGFGRGIFLRNYAKTNPNKSVVGAEVRKQVVMLLDERLKQEDVPNVFTVHANGFFCLTDMFEDRSIDNIFIFHPDPWIKKRHIKRRVINTRLLEAAKLKLKPTGTLHISTDVKFLWDDIIEEISNHNSFKPVDNHPFWTTSYLTHWNQISIEDKRTEFYCSFQVG